MKSPENKEAPPKSETKPQDRQVPEKTARELGRIATKAAQR